MAKNFSFRDYTPPAPKPPLSPKRKRQRLGGILIIIWAVISFIEGFGSMMDTPDQSWIFISLTIGFCLIGGFFIFLSLKPDARWEEERRAEAEAAESEIPLPSEDTDEEEDDSKSKYLE